MKWLILCLTLFATFHGAGSCSTAVGQERQALAINDLHAHALKRLA